MQPPKLLKAKLSVVMFFKLPMSGISPLNLLPCISLRIFISYLENRVIYIEYLQRLQALKVRERAGDISGELVVVQVQLLQARQFTESSSKATRELIIEYQTVLVRLAKLNFESDVVARTL